MAHRGDRTLIVTGSVLGEQVNNNSVTLSNSLSTLAVKDLIKLRWRAKSVGERKALIIYRIIELGGEVQRINAETDLGMKPKSFDYHFRGTKERSGLEPLGIVEQIDRGTYRLTSNFTEVIREIRITSGEEAVEAGYDARIRYDRDKWNDRDSDTFEEDYERYLRNIGLL